MWSYRYADVISCAKQTKWKFQIIFPHLFCLRRRFAVVLTQTICLRVYVYSCQSVNCGICTIIFITMNAIKPNKYADIWILDAAEQCVCFKTHLYH